MVLARLQLGKYQLRVNDFRQKSSGCVGTAFLRLCELPQPVLRGALSPHRRVGAALSSARPVLASVGLTEV